MRRLFQIFMLSVLLPLLPSAVFGEVPSDGFAVVDSTITASLLTCSPGQEVYELYGHTAIRVKWTEARGDTIFPRDVVYNFGLFDFNQPHFVWKFTLGECDYIVGPMMLPRFLAEYEYRGSSVTEQVLALKTYEARRLLLTLDSLCRPENRTYRYNIFRFNCTTKARDVIEQCVDGQVVYPVRPRRNSFRTILHQFTEGHPWAREGNDLLLGAEADTLLCERDEQFSPIYMMQYLDSAFVDRGRQEYTPLMSERHELLAANPELQQRAAEELPQFPLTPRALWWSLFALGLLCAVVELVRRRVLWPVDAVLMTLQGVAGCLVAFMMLFSEHATVGSNWQVWVLNPIPLFFVYAVVKADIRRQRTLYHSFAAVWLTLFLVLYAVLPQDFSALILPLALLLLSRAVLHLLIYKR